MSLSDPDDLVLALYVRDACGLAARPDVPRLAPPVPSSRAAADSANLGEQWSAWWSALLENRPQGRAWYGAFVTEQLGSQPPPSDHADLLPIGPDLMEALVSLLRPAMRWRATNRYRPRRGPEVPREVALLETYLVKDIERDIGRRAHPFAYRLEVVPVRGRWFVDLSPTDLLASEELVADSDSYRDVLRPRLTALA